MENIDTNKDVQEERLQNLKERAEEFNDYSKKINLTEALEFRYSEGIIIYPRRGEKMQIDYRNLHLDKKYIVAQIRYSENGEMPNLFKELKKILSNNINRIVFKSKDNGSYTIQKPLDNLNKTKTINNKISI